MKDLDYELNYLKGEVSELYHRSLTTEALVDETLSFQNALDDIEQKLSEFQNMAHGVARERAYNLLGPFSKKQLLYSDKYNIASEMTDLLLYPTSEWNSYNELLYRLETDTNYINKYSKSSVYTPLTINEIKELIVEFSSMSAKKLFIETSLK